MGLEIFKIKNNKQEEEFMDAMSKYCNEVYEADRKEKLEWLENDLQRVIYLDWSYGGRLWEWHDETKKHTRAKRYLHVSDKDWDKAGSAISGTVSNGLG